MKQQCQNTVLVIKFRTTLLMEIIRKVCIPQCQAKNCCQLWMLIDSHGRHIHSSHRGKLGSGEGGKTKLILIYPSNPSSEGKCSKFKDWKCINLNRTSPYLTRSSFSQGPVAAEALCQRSDTNTAGCEDKLT